MENCKLYIKDDCDSVSEESDTDIKAAGNICDFCGNIIYMTIFCLSTI